MKMEEEVLEKSHEQIQKEQFEAEELRKKNQIEFDPKLHGVGTSPVLEPSSIKELFKYVDARFARLEGMLTGGSKPAKKTNGTPAE